MTEPTCHLGQHKRIEVTCLDCIERLKAERDRYVTALMDIVSSFEESRRVGCMDFSPHMYRVAKAALNGEVKPDEKPT